MPLYYVSPLIKARQADFNVLSHLKPVLHLGRMEDALADFLKNFTAKRFDDIDKYERDEFIGMGSFGIVYKYKLKEEGANKWASGLPMYIAVKMLHQTLQDILKPNRRTLMTREVHLHESLKHPNIIECYGYCLVDKAVCLGDEPI